MCGATEGGLSLDGVNVAKEAVIQGQVLRGGGGAGAPTPTCACSTAPVSSPPRCPTSATGHFRFFAGDGEWTLRTLAPKAEPVDTRVVGRHRLGGRGAGARHGLTTAVRLRDRPALGTGRFAAFSP